MTTAEAAAAAAAAVVVVAAAETAAAAQHAWQHRRPSVRQSVNRCASGVVSVSVSLRARVTGSSALGLTLRVFTHRSIVGEISVPWSHDRERRGRARDVNRTIRACRFRNFGNEDRSREKRQRESERGWRTPRTTAPTTCSSSRASRSSSRSGSPAPRASSSIRVIFGRYRGKIRRPPAPRRYLRHHHLRRRFLRPAATMTVDAGQARTDNDDEPRRRRPLGVAGQTDPFTSSRSIFYGAYSPFSLNDFPQISAKS